MSESTLLLLERLRARLRAGRRRLLWADLAFGALVTGGVLGAVLLAALVLEAALWLGVGERTVLFWSLAATLVGLLGWYVAAPLLRMAGLLQGPADADVARRAGAVFPQIGDRLTTLLDLAEGRGSASSGALVDRAVRGLGREVEPVPFEQIESLAPARRAAPWAAAPMLGLVLFAFVAPADFAGALQRLAHPGTFFARPAPFALALEPGDATVVRGADLGIEAVATGRRIPPTATLWIERAGEREPQAVRIGRDTTGAFLHTIADVRAPFRYRLEAGPVETAWHRVRVVAPPAVQRMQVRVAPPGYSGLPARTLPDGLGDVRALKGATVHVSLALDGEPTRSAWIEVVQGPSTRRIPLRVRGDRATGAFSVQAEGTWRVRLRSANGLESRDPVDYPIGVLDDAPPHVAFLAAPGGTAGAEAVRDLALRVADDYGLSRLVLRWRLARTTADVAPTTTFRTIVLPLQRGARAQDVAYRWRLAAALGRPLAPGDEIQFYAEVRDNDAVSGYKAARTPTYTLRRLDLTDRLDQLDQTQDTAAQAADSLRSRAAESRERFERFRDEVRRDQDPGWEERRQLERLSEEQQQMQQQAEALQQQMRELVEQLRDEPLVDPETQRLYEEMQRVMDELDSPELQRLLEQMQESLEQLDMQQMMQQMDQFEFDEEQFRERLERAMQLLERLRTMQELDEAARRAADLAERMEQMQEATEASQGDRAEQQRLAEEQRRNAEAARELDQSLQELQERMDGQRGAPSDGLQELRDETGSEALPQQMQDNAGQMQNGQTEPAQQGQQQMQEALQQLAQGLQSLGEQMSGQAQQRQMEGLRRALDDVLTLSREQEELRESVRRIGGNAPALRPLARQQVDLAAGLAAVSDTLRTLAAEIPQMSADIQQHTATAQRAMNAATATLTERQAAPSAGHQKSAMTSLNDLALMLSELLGQMQQQQGGQGQGSMMQQLQQMQGQQQGLGQQIQQMLNDQAGERLSQSQAERARQQGEQQARIREELRRLLDTAPTGGEDGLSPQQRSALQRALEQMDAAARDLEDAAGERDPEAARRAAREQPRILQRLLEATESANRQDQEERREGQTGTDQPPEAAPPLPPRPPSRQDLLRRDLLRALDAGYHPDYQDLIRRYFERLQRQAGAE